MNTLFYFDCLSFQELKNIAHNGQWEPFTVTRMGRTDGMDGRRDHTPWAFTTSRAPANFLLDKVESANNAKPIPQKEFACFALIFLKCATKIKRYNCLCLVAPGKLNNNCATRKRELKFGRCPNVQT